MCCKSAGNAGNFFPDIHFKGSCLLVTPASITARAWRKCRDAKRSRHSRRTRNPQLYVSAKRLMYPWLAPVHLLHWYCGYHGVSRDGEADSFYLWRKTMSWISMKRRQFWWFENYTPVAKISIGMFSRNLIMSQLCICLIYFPLLSTPGENIKRQSVDNWNIRRKRNRSIDMKYVQCSLLNEICPLEPHFGVINATL